MGGGWVGGGVYLSSCGCMNEPIDLNLRHRFGWDLRGGFVFPGAPQRPGTGRFYDRPWQECCITYTFPCTSALVSFTETQLMEPLWEEGGGGGGG